MLTRNIPPPPPMPDVRAALLGIEDARAALHRTIWNKAQLVDVIRSVEFHLSRAKAAAGLPTATDTQMLMDKLDRIERNMK